MCLGIPGNVVSVDGLTAMVDIGGVVYHADTTLTGQLQAGDYVLVHAGFVLEKLDTEEAEATLELFDSLTRGALPA